MKPARILLLAVALIAGGLAAFLATRGQGPAPAAVETVTQVREEAKAQVLVASTNIGVGQRLNQNFVEWQDWPEGALRPEYITASTNPDAIELMAGTVARFEIFPGEPIRRAKLVRSDQGYLSAVLPQGMRAVSIGVTAESGAGGFIVPNDRVDVVQTRRASTGSSSQVILANVKVLAIGHRLGEVGATSGMDPNEDPQAQIFNSATLATLELDPAQAETIITASSGGQLSLVLRSVQDFSQPADLSQQRSSQAIRLIRFGNETNVVSGVADTIAVSDDPPSADYQDPFVLPDVSIDDPSMAPGASPLTEVN